ncbi:MAG TPA: hypothetical protein VFV62_12040 [Gaiellaceae bacterium]|nr:hypothetical protein [Gaiellaceae bacterium]
MKYARPYTIPESPPAELLAELDAAAQALDELSARAAQLTLGMDEQTHGLRIELDEGDGSRRLSPTQLFNLLSYQ